MRCLRPNAAPPPFQGGKFSELRPPPLILSEVRRKREAAVPAFIRNVDWTGARRISRHSLNEALFLAQSLFFREICGESEAEVPF